ncbi:MULTISPECIES: sensor histidine kinase [Clostridia]|nr:MULTISPECIES: sensor histidine kinase [Clostridia]CDB75772.1 integral membrane sensor signal transduction histidine kinase [Clostridium sp. CAG:265]
MDINLKSNDKKENKILTSLIILLTLFIAAIGMFKTYPFISKLAKDTSYNYLENYDFAKILIESSYALDYKIKNQNSEEIKEPKDIFIDKNSMNYLYEGNEESYNDEVYYRFNENFNRWITNLKGSLSNLQYFALDKESGLTTTNISDSITVKEDKNIDLSEIDMNKYRFTVVLNFDENGNISLSDVKGVNANTISSTMYDYKDIIDGEASQIITPIKNMTYVFAVPTELVYSDHLSWNIDNASYYGYESYGTLISASIIAIILLTALIFPYKKVKDFNILKIPFEIWFIIISCDIALWIAAAESMIRVSYLKELPIIKNQIVSEGMVSTFNIAVWFGIFAIAFFGMTVIKSMFKIGFKEYFKSRSIIGRILVWIFIYLKKTINYVTEINLEENNNKYILKLVLINAAILLILSFIWFFEIPFIIIYSIILFIVITKYVDDISDKYKRLTTATNEIAAGNLDVKIEEDLGVFNPFKDNLEKIQGGFKKAVQEEVKSQRMKTDLISNVSHDLKTPLTAIITYVDLLKDENLSQEKRKQYIEIVDRKSQRLQNLIEDLFEMSKASSGNITLNIEEIDIVSLMKQTLLELDDKIKASSLTFKNNFPEEKVALQLDSQCTFRIFENIIINATKYAMANSRVYLDIIEREDNVEVIMKNMAAEEIDFNTNEIVERFVRGDESRNTEGSGLGLAIAKSFVELQGGSFKIEVDGDLFKVIMNFKKN